jgi:hypothetical protein
MTPRENLGGAKLLRRENNPDWLNLNYYLVHVAEADDALAFGHE